MTYKPEFESTLWADADAFRYQGSWHPDSEPDHLVASNRKAAEEMARSEEQAATDAAVKTARQEVEAALKTEYHD